VESENGLQEGQVVLIQSASGYNDRAPLPRDGATESDGVQC
jgi:hypothetical protein